MSLESLFQHIIFSEHRAEESRRLLREVRSEINRCRENIKKAAEELNEEKIKLESKVQQFSEKAFLLQLLKTHENALKRQCSEITNEKNMLLQAFEATKRKVTEEEEKFIKEITDFNNEYDITKKRELLVKENIKIEISDLENQANILKKEMKSVEHDSDQLNELQKQKSELIQELFTLQRKLEDFEDKKNEAVRTTKNLEAEKIKITEKPQNDAECLRLKKELELYKEDDMQSVYDALQTEIEFLELMFGIWIAALLLAGTSTGEEVCYERVGCFKDGLPWTGTLSRQLAGLPWSPEEINTRFLLYTRRNPKTHQEISAVNYLTIQASNFGTDKITHINIPGWKSDGKWQQDMCNVLLKVEDVNCINLDWINGSQQYIQAVNNLRVVGAEVAYFIDVLKQKFGYSPSKVHLIGHSLGAHLAGEAGSRTPGLGRITGLDPAGPYFHNTPKEVRLDPSDANFVDVIHTNAVRFLFELGAGTINACGHLDFYPNGGKHMPGCEDLITPLFTFDLNVYKEEMSSFFECNHARSHRFYTESILNPDAFIAYPCRSYTSFKAGNCFHCPKEGCPTMGHFADRFHLKNREPNRSYYFLNTGTFSPFARWRHKLSVKLDGNNVTQGSIFLRVGGTTGETGEFGIISGTLKPGMTYTNLIDADINVGNITSIEFIWKEHSFGHSQNKLGAEMVIDISGKYGYESTFCSQNVIGPNIAQVLKPC